jgi:hypothetical protein
MNEITQVLERIQKGEASAAEVLLPLVYEELRKHARRPKVSFARMRETCGRARLAPRSM